MTARLESLGYVIGDGFAATTFLAMGRSAPP
jgi:hypothetical protein